MEFFQNYFAEQDLRKLGSALGAALVATLVLFILMQILIAVDDVSIGDKGIRIADGTITARELELLQD